MINKEYLLNTHDLVGEELKIEDKMNTLDKAELKDFLCFCNKRKVYPSNEALKHWIKETDKNYQILNAAKHLTEQNLFGDVYNLLKMVVDTRNKLDNEGCSECSHDDIVFDIDAWIREFIGEINA